MARSSLGYLGIVFVLLAEAAIACTGDAPAPVSETPGGPDASGSDAGVDSSTTTTNDAATPTCAAPLQDCNGDGTCETSLDGDSKNCGACGHDCGGAACQNQKCQPLTLMQTVTSPVALAVNETALVVLGTDGPRVCPKTGCAGGNPSALATGQTIASSAHALYVDSDNAYWLGRTSAGTKFPVMKCAVAGCGLAPTPIDDEQLGTELRGEGKSALRYDPTGTLTKISLDGSVAKQYLTIANLSNSLRFALAGGKMAFSNNDGATGGTRGVWYGPFDNVAPTRLMNEGDLVAIAGDVVYASRAIDGTYDAVFYCAVSGCGGVGAPLGGTGPSIGTGKVKDMTADASGVYWVESMGAVGRVMRCALPDCPKGPEELAVGQESPNAIATDAAFVYWLSAGKALRVAK